MIHSFFLISNTGEVIIEKHWRGVSSRGICDYFWDEVNKYDTKEEMPPIIATPKYFLISVLRDGMFLLAITTSEIQPLLVIELLHRIFDIFTDYFSVVEEMTIKDNFSTVYQLLEEIMDYGYPLTTEPNALKAMIKPPDVITKLTSVTLGSSLVSDILPDGTISNMPWRKTGVKYNQNEVYIDIIEEIDAIVDMYGNLISSDVSGFIMCNSQLSGVPDLCLSFSNPGLIDDCSFHPCVRYNRFDRDRVVSFVPPDGVFELMRYRVNAYGGVSAPCYVLPQLKFDYALGQGQLSISVGHKVQHSLLFPGQTKKPPLVIEEVALNIPFSKNVKTVNMTVTLGTVLFDESTKTIKWTIGKLTADKIPKLTGMVYLQSNHTEEIPSIELSWRVPTASISGLSVASLTLTNEIYKPYKGVRTLAQAGKFTIRFT